MYNTQQVRRHLDLSECVQILKTCQYELRAYDTNYSIDELAIFGSVARKQNHSRSDIDILVHFFALPSLFELVEIASFFTKKLNMKVDLVVKNGIDQKFMANISKDIIYVGSIGEPK